MSISSSTINLASMSSRATTVSGSKSVTSHLEDGSVPSRKLACAILVLTLIALGVTGYLATVAMNSTKIAGCGGGSIFDCDDVINSRWSRWMGIPVSYLAFGMYATLLGSIIVGAMRSTNDLTQKVAWSVVVAIGLSAGMAAIWFISLQVFVLKHLCTYCLAAHTCGLIISALLLWFQPMGLKAVGLLSLVSLLGFGVLSGGQLMFKPVTYKVIEHEAPAGDATEVEAFEFAPPIDFGAEESADDQSSTNQIKQSNPSGIAKSVEQSLVSLAGIVRPNHFIQSQYSLVVFQDSGSSTKQATASKQDDNNAVAKPKERRFVSMPGGTMKLDVAQWPLAGKQDAKYIFIEMFDYTCDHCRRTHGAIAGAKRILGDDVAILALQVPLNSNCNNTVTQTGPRMAEACEISKLAVAVWRVDPSKFDEFHNFLMTTPTVVSYGQAIAKANELVDATKLDQVLASEVTSQYIAQHVELYKKVGAGTVPKMLFPGTSIIGEFTSPEALADVIKTNAK